MKVEPFERYTREYEEWFERNKYVYFSELNAVRELLPESGLGLEIGVGSGRFASPLGIKFGVEPSPRMGGIAKERGMTLVAGVAEALPLRDETFDYVLMVTTLCFLDDVHASFRETHRILRKDGYFVNGFIDKKSELGRLYEKEKVKNVFYRMAQFYSINEVIAHLTRAGFGYFEFRQTVFHELSEIKKAEEVRPGYEEASFVVIRARKSN